MKKILLINFLVIAVLAGHGYAQMGSGMSGGYGGQQKMGGGMMGGQGSMGGQQEQMGQGGMMMSE